MTIDVKNFTTGAAQTVKTIDDLAADGGQATIGAKADAKSAATDVTAVSAMSVWKQISASVQAAAASVAGVLGVSQSGVWTVQPGNTANTTAWKVDGSAVTQPVSAAALPLPTGAATAANQTAPLPAGTNLIGKIQLGDGTTALPILAASSGAPAASVPAIAVSVRDTNANGQATMANSAPVAIASNQSAIATTATLQTGANVIGALSANQSVNLAQVAGATTAVGSGVQASALRTTLATDSPGIVTLGQAAKAASVPMAIASDQLGPAASATSLPVVLTPPVASLGSYSMGLTSGTMAAGLAGGSPIASFRYGGANKALVKRIVLSAGNAGTGFAAGVAIFNVFAARGFTASDSGGTAATLTGNNGKLATSFATTGISDFRVSSTATLTAGTRTLDATALGTFTGPVPVTANAVLVNPGTWIFDAEASMLPLILAQNEGFVIQVTVPATGTWSFSVTVYWDEVSAF